MNKANTILKNWEPPHDVSAIPKSDPANIARNAILRIERLESNRVRNRQQPHRESNNAKGSDLNQPKLPLCIIDVENAMIKLAKSAPPSEVPRRAIK